MTKEDLIIDILNDQNKALNVTITSLLGKLSLIENMVALTLMDTTQEEKNKMVLELQDLINFNDNATEELMKASQEIYDKIETLNSKNINKKL